MKHLNRSELVDLVESSPALPADRVRHVQSCQQCRGRAEMLRAMRSIASVDDTPEPSPLFWSHFSARVAEQVRSEPAPNSTRRWSVVPFATWAAAGTVLVLLVTVGISRMTPLAPASPGQTEVSSASDLVAAAPDDNLENDEAWAVVRAAAADLGWEDADEAGISAHPGDVENEALQLNAAERGELARLVDEDLKRNGA